ncbi:ATP-binding protein [Gordonia araii NBRC 100433]|nr:ATP-binding protein [Gordonia araii NBRC 100433]
MAMTNRDRVHKAMDLLGPALNRFLAKVLAPDLGDSPWVNLLRLRDQNKGASTDKLYNPDDPMVGLRIITENVPNAVRKGWYPFNDHLSRVQSSWATELREVRNRDSHNEPFTNEDAQRALDTTERFLMAIGAPTEAEQVRKLRNDVVRIAHDREDVATARGNPSLAVGSENLPPWREVLSPHPDVASGNFNAAEFAADLYSVANPNADAKKNPEYTDPVQFFERTYLTHGLQDLIKRNVARLSGDLNASPVVNLQTNFGGGKTHSMLALWHLASDTPSSAYPDDVAALAGPLDALRGTKIRRVALVGNQLEPAKPDTRDGRPGIRTVWGELAWQLGGQEAFEIVADADRTSTSPGAALRELFELYSPAVILIDEWVAYARQLVNTSDLPGGDFDTQFTFAQTLTEAAKATKGVQVVVSIPASSNPNDGGDEISDEEVGGEYGREALMRLRQIIGRTADQWQPANAQESFEIVRRRIFATPDAEAMTKIGAIAKSVVEFYRKHAADFPSEVRDNSYADRIKQCYPIHPELFDRLYEDWSTLDRFQRTRGVLRVMNQIVGSLWRAQDKAPLILPGGVPLENPDFVDEIRYYLDENWGPIIDSDVAGTRSVPFHVDKDNDVFGKRGIAERLARTVFMAATPALHTAHKGVDKPRIFLGTAIPGDTPGNFHSALDHLANKSTYLYTEASRFWYDTQANTTRTARDHADNLPDADVWAEVDRRLADARKSSPDRTFAAVHVSPSSSAEVPDEASTRLVIVPMRYSHSARTKSSKAVDWAKEVIERRGEGNRTFKNSLVFVAADANRAPELDAAVREFLAWRHVYQNAESLGLGGQQTTQARTRMQRADDIVATRLLDTYVWGIYPRQSPGEPTYSVDTSSTSGTAADLIERTARKLEDQIATARSASLIRMDLDGPLAPAWESGSITAGELHTYYATYPYLPRLRDRETLFDGLRAVDDEMLWHNDGFAFAEAYDPTAGRFVGLRLPRDSEAAHVVESTLIIKPDIAQEQRDEEVRDYAATPDDDQTVSGAAGTAEPRTPSPGSESSPSKTRYFGSVTLDPNLPAKAFNEIHREVLQHLSVPGSRVQITLEIETTASDGFPENVIRTVRENGTTLRFTQNEFE